MPPNSTPPVQDLHDYIVVGAGSAGCVVAGRLAATPGVASVLLVEAGEAAEAHPETLSADGFKYAFAKDALMWHRMSAPQAQCQGRSLYAGSGRVVGGSGGVNGMVYTRGDRQDFSAWPAGWQWDDVRPAFIALEERLQPRPRPATAFSERCVQAAQAAGLSRKDGLNDGDLRGFVGYNDMNYAGDRRNSSYRAFVQPAPADKLQLRTSAQVQRLLFETGPRATGIEYRQAGQTRRAYARREIILCAGALATPKLLLLSGVGPATALGELGIAVQQDAPGVGQNLQDHPNVCLFYRSRAAVDFEYPQLYGFDREGDQTDEAGPDTCYVFYAAPASIQQSMQRMLPILALPGRLYQSRVLRGALRRMIDLAFVLPPVRRFVRTLFGIVVILGKPSSRGSLRLRSADPQAPAEIDLAYYQTEQDRQTMLAAVARAKHIARQEPLRSVAAKPLSAGARTEKPSRIWAWIGQATMTTFHYCGSCRMGDDAASPVDTQLRVKGVHGLRVADASVIPEIPVSALNAPSMMIGHRAVDFILAGE